MEAGYVVTVRFSTYKSHRHYGGRQILTTTHLCRATFVEMQRDHTALVVLLENCAGYCAGHKIAINPIDFNI